MPLRETRTAYKRAAAGCAAAIAALGMTACDFSRPGGTSAWDGGAQWYGSAAAPAPAPKTIDQLPPPPRPASPASNPAGAAVPPQPPAAPSSMPPSAPPRRVAVAPAVAVAIPESREPVSIGPAHGSSDTASSAPVPIVIAAPVAIPVEVPTTPPAASTVRLPAIQLRGRLYRSFGDLGRIETDDGLRLEASGTGSPIAWCAVQGNPRLTIVTAQGVCFYDRDADGLIETMAIIGRPELGYMELGPFAYARAD